jgi:hypothetical protein
VFTRRVALPTFIQPYHPPPCSPMYRRRRRRSRYNSSCPNYSRTQAPSRQNTLRSISFTTTPPRQTYLTDQSRQSVILISGRSAIDAFAILSIHSTLLQVRTATGRDSPDRYDNLTDLAPLLHPSQSSFEKQQPHFSVS